MYIRNGFHLPEDEWECNRCDTLWLAEYEACEHIMCPNCGSLDARRVR